MILNIVGLEINVPELIWTIINFFLLMFLLKIFLYNPILKILDERKAKINESIAESKSAEKAFEEANAAVAAELSEETGRARELVGRAKAEAEKEKDACISEAQREADDLNKSLREKIAEEEKTAIGEVEDSMPELVMLLTEKLLGDNAAQCSPELVKSCVEKAKGN